MVLTQSTAMAQQRVGGRATMRSCITIIFLLLLTRNIVVSAQDPCSICPAGLEVTLPDVIILRGFAFVLQEDTACADLEAQAQNGNFSTTECALLRSYGVGTECGCSDGTTPITPAPVEPETPAPTKAETSEPTEAPATEPTILETETDSPTSTPPGTMIPTVVTECGVNEVIAISGEPVTIPPCIEDVDKMTVTTWPRNGSLMVRDNGSVVYTPNDNFIGQDVIEIETCNATGDHQC